MADSKLKTKLKRLNKGYQEAREEFDGETGGFSTIPEGPYKIDDVQLELMTTKAGKIMVARKCRIAEGDLEGKLIGDTMQLETDRGPEFLVKFFNMIGASCEDLEEIEETIELINSNEGAEYRVFCKDDGQYNNVFFNEVLEYGDKLPMEGMGEEDGEEEGDEEGGEEGPDLDEMSRKELKAYIKEEGLEVKVMKKDSDDDIRDKINEALSEEEEGGEDGGEEEGAEEEEPPAKKTAAKKPVAKRGKKSGLSDEEIEDGLREVADAYGIRLKKGLDKDGIAKILKDYDFKKKDSTKEEIAVLEAVGISLK